MDLFCKQSKLSLIASLLILTAANLIYCVPSMGDDPVLNVLRPVAHAVVREVVAIRVSPGDLPDGGYVGITIDSVFKTARVLPINKNDPIFEWDTKESYTTQDDPTTPKFIKDGDHEIKVDVYDQDGNLKGTATIPLTVKNMLTPPATAIKLVYHWEKDMQLKYSRQTSLDMLPAGQAADGTVQSLQASSLRFSRSVEDVGNDAYLLRDRVLPKFSYVAFGGQSQRVESVYNVKSKYRTVNSRGVIIGEMTPFITGQHFGFSIPVLPDRKVAIGDAWQAPVYITPEWASDTPEKVQSECRLDGFEWQNGYPTAKIIEKFDGDVKFKLNSGVTVDFPSVDFERDIFLAYNSGRLVHTKTMLKLTGPLSQSDISAFGLTSPSSGGVPASGPGLTLPGIATLQNAVSNYNNQLNAALNYDQDNSPAAPANLPSGNSTGQSAAPSVTLTATDTTTLIT